MTEQVLLRMDPLLNDMRQKFGIQLVDDKFGALASTGSVRELTVVPGNNSCVLTDVPFWWSAQDIQSILTCALSQEETMNVSLHPLPFSVGALRTRTWRLNSPEAKNLLGTVMVGSHGEQIRALSMSEYYSIKENVLRQRNKWSSSNRSYVEAATSSRPPGPDSQLS